MANCWKHMLKRAWGNIGIMEKMLIDLIENCPCCGKSCKMATMKQKKEKGPEGILKEWKRCVQTWLKTVPVVKRFVKWRNVGKHMITRARGSIGRMVNMSTDLTENYPCCGNSCKMLKCWRNTWWKEAEKILDEWKGCQKFHCPCCGKSKMTRCWESTWAHERANEHKRVCGKIENGEDVNRFNGDLSKEL